MKWFRKSGERAIARARASLGAIYARGTGSVAGDVDGVTWFLRAAEQGNPNGQAHLGLSYLWGLGVPTDNRTSAGWFKAAAEQGHGLAQYFLGFMYAAGEGVPQDHVLAHMWVNLSAAHGIESDFSDRPTPSASELRALIAEQMTRSQIEEAQRMAREWMENPLG